MTKVIFFFHFYIFYIGFTIKYISFNFFSSLEQFEIIVGQSLVFFLLTKSSSSFFVYIAITVFTLVPSSAVQIVVESFFFAVLDTSISEVGRAQLPLVPHIFFSFFYFFFINRISLLPGGITFTAQFFISVIFSVIFVVFLFVVIFFRFSNQTFGYFLPAGTPLELVLLLVPIELVSFLSRALSLGLRICANILSGHALQDILSGFAQHSSIFFFLIFVSMITPVMGLETIVALLQVYVLVQLIIIYFIDLVALLL